MSAQLQVKSENQIVKLDQTSQALHEVTRTKQLCVELMKTPHYAKLTEVGIFAIVQKANSIGMNPLEALNGGMYFVQGKVEMQGQSMLALIRQHGHSVQIDPKSTDAHVIMHGKRADNGDQWTVSFSVDDAKKAGIYRNQWEKYPKTMCIWRCVSQLSRFLFSDILKGCYVAGEISEAVSFDHPVDHFVEANEMVVEQPKVEVETPSSEEVVKLLDILEECTEEYKKTLQGFMKKHKIESFYKMPKDLYGKILVKATSERENNLKSKKLVEANNESSS